MREYISPIIKSEQREKLVNKYLSSMIIEIMWLQKRENIYKTIIIVEMTIARFQSTIKLKLETSMECI